MNIFRASQVGDDWVAVRDELERAFVMSREAARAEESFVFVVHNDDLLGRRGAGRAMVATGLLSAARTAALEGAKSGWTVNVVAHSEGTPADVLARVASGIDSAITGELIRIGPDHLGKALP